MANKETRIPREIKDSPEYPRPLIGSIIRAENNSIWYCCGSWLPNEIEKALPCILAYVPDDETFPSVRNQKFIEVSGSRYLKVFGQQLSVYRGLYYPAVSNLIERETFGKVSFLLTKYIKEVKDPHSFTKHYIEKVPSDGKALTSLCRILGITLNDIGITGSSLMLEEPIKRHELDVGIYGRKKSKRAYETIQEGLASGVFIKASDFHHLPFYYQNVQFDPQFGESAYDLNPFDGSTIVLQQEVNNVRIAITESPDSIFFPAIYETDSLKLISFRPGQRAFFKPGQEVFFDKINLAKIHWNNEIEEKAFIVVNDETGKITKS